MYLPEVRIKDGFLLREKVTQHLHELWAKDGDRLATDEEMAEIVKAYQTAWKPYETTILEAITKKTGLSFRQNTIDVYIAPWLYAFSEPMVIGVTYSPDRFVEILAHEIMHRLLSDNNETSEYAMSQEELSKLYGQDFSFVTLIHIPVHALMQHVFNDVLNEPRRTLRDKEMCKKYDEYDKAWEYVDTKGYKSILVELEDAYKNLSAING